jgi:hypothetical protein
MNENISKWAKTDWRAKFFFASFLFLHFFVIDLERDWNLNHLNASQSILRKRHLGNLKILFRMFLKWIRKHYGLVFWNHSKPLSTFIKVQLEHFIFTYALDFACFWLKTQKYKLTFIISVNSPNTLERENFSQALKINTKHKVSTCK